MTQWSIRGIAGGMGTGDGSAARVVMEGQPMADEPTMPLGGGAALRELLRRIKETNTLVYSEGPGHLATQQCRIPRDPIRDEIRKRHSLFVALATPDESLTDDDKRTILEHDIRVGFQPPGDWPGALRELRERAGMFNG